MWTTPCSSLVEAVVIDAWVWRPGPHYAHCRTDSERWQSWQTYLFMNAVSRHRSRPTSRREAWGIKLHKGRCVELIGGGETAESFGTFLPYPAAPAGSPSPNSSFQEDHPVLLGWLLNHPVFHKASIRQAQSGLSSTCLYSLVKCHPHTGGTQRPWAALHKLGGQVQLLMQPRH